ncbi:MAG: 1-acyl-sn-glycerol-3-phosphate acyltransferase [Planctomycetaceae bacterium]|nr:1-acyl-sn-glycerol-3-phosphate acyltransferase [Planctomycetaceae bacterium]
MSFLIAVLVAPALAVLLRLGRSPMSLVQRMLWGLAYLLVRLRWRTRWEGSLPALEGRGGVIVCNHRSSVDPFFVQTATGRKVHWMVAREYCEHPLLRWFLWICEVIPVGRGGIDTAATKAALRIVEAGGLVGMFPEGRINMTADLLLPIRPGAAHIALKAGVPLVPCFIEGSPYDGVPSSPLFMSARVVARFGQPVDCRLPPDGVVELQAAQAIMRRWAAEIARLAEQPDFAVEFAGRQWKPTEEELAQAMSARRASA